MLYLIGVLLCKTDAVDGFMEASCLETIYQANNSLPFFRSYPCVRCLLSDPREQLLVPHVVKGLSTKRKVREGLA